MWKRRMRAKNQKVHGFFFITKNYWNLQNRRKVCNRPSLDASVLELGQSIIITKINTTVLMPNHFRRHCHLSLFCVARGQIQSQLPLKNLKIKQSLCWAFLPCFFDPLPPPLWYVSATMLISEQQGYQHRKCRIKMLASLFGIISTRTMPSYSCPIPPPIPLKSPETLFKISELRTQLCREF